MWTIFGANYSLVREDSHTELFPMRSSDPRSWQTPSKFLFGTCHSLEANSSSSASSMFDIEQHIKSLINQNHNQLEKPNKFTAVSCHNWSYFDTNQPPTTSRHFCSLQTLRPPTNFPLGSHPSVALAKMAASSRSFSQIIFSTLSANLEAYLSLGRHERRHGTACAIWKTGKPTKTGEQPCDIRSVRWGEISIHLDSMMNIFLGGCMEDGGCCCQKQMIETNCHKWNFTRFQSTSPFKCISKMYGSIHTSRLLISTLTKCMKKKTRTWKILYVWTCINMQLYIYIYKQKHVKELLPKNATT